MEIEMELKQSTFVKHKLPCPSCGGSDPVSLNGDGSAKCFSCGTFFTDYKNPKGTTTITKANNTSYLNSYAGTYGALTDRNISEKIAKKYGVRIVYGNDGSVSSLSNLVSTVGVVATDVTGVGTARSDLGACGYGEDKGIFAYGYSGGYVNMSNLVSNAGVIATDVTGVGTARGSVMATQYGYDKGIFFGGENGLLSEVNLVTNVGVIGTDAGTSATAKGSAAGCSFN